MGGVGPNIHTIFYHLVYLRIHPLVIFGPHRSFSLFVIFGLDPKIQGREVLIILRVPAFWIPVFTGMTGQG